MFSMLLAATLQGPVALPPRDRVRLAEAMRVAEQVRDGVWPGWSATAMPILLVTDSVEYLLGHDTPGAGFRQAGYDSLLRRTVWTRPRRFPPTLLATFPAVAGEPTIVVGSSERVGTSSTAWVLTLLHEHFHQMQYSRPDYYRGVEDLGLSRGDSTGRWMLDYPFPYDSPQVQEAVHRLARSLAGALRATSEGRGEAVRALLAERERVRAALAPADFRYLEFQLWQEGVPRYIELGAAQAAGRLGEPAEAFRHLPDYESYGAVVDRARQRLEEELDALSLGKERRVSFYPLGAALALVLERTRPDWKSAYFARPFELTSLFFMKP